MKETRLFYLPALADGDTPDTILELPEEEAAHALRVLRLSKGDSLSLTDGQGQMATAVICETSKKHCSVRLQHIWQPPRLWQGSIHIAVAPTKNMDRMEWFVEKAVEIGVDRITFLSTAYSERTSIRLDRLQRHAISAMKQSHKAWLPQIQGPVPFERFLEEISSISSYHIYICHCYEVGQKGEVVTTDSLVCPTSAEKPLLLNVLSASGDALTLIGPEGDFSIDEVNRVVRQGGRSVSLGTSRLRTETAALAAVHMMYLKKCILS